MTASPADTLSDTAKSALSMIFNAPGELTVKELRRRVREEYGRGVEHELRSVFLTEGDGPCTDRETATSYSRP